MRLTVLSLSLGVVIGCSHDASIAPPPNKDTDSTNDTAQETGLPQAPAPQWYSIDGELVIAAGQPIEGSSVTVALWNESDVGTPHAYCSQQVNSAGQPVGQPPDDVNLFGLWSFDVDTEQCQGLTTPITVGIGPLVPALYPSIDALGFSRRHTRGLFTSRGPATQGLTVFGVAGTARQLAGNGEPVSLSALPDGVYQLHGVYLLPL